MLKLPEGDLEFRRSQESGAYQRQVLFHALAFCKHWNVAIDVGAHVGFITRDLAPHFRKVYAFEPIPQNVECLKQNVSDNVVIYQKALGDRRGFCDLINPTSHNSGAWEVTYGNSVVIARLDEYGLAPDFIKIDTQRTEYDVLLGARGTLEEHHPVALIETTMNGVEDTRIKQLMAKMDYELAITHGKNTIFVWKKQLIEVR